MRKLLLIVLLLPLIGKAQAIQFDTIGNYKCTLIFNNDKDIEDNYHCAKQVVISQRAYIGDNSLLEDKLNNTIIRKVYVEDDNSIYVTLSISVKEKKVRIILNDFNVFDNGNNEWINLKDKPINTDNLMKDKTLKQFVPGFQVHNHLLELQRGLQAILIPSYMDKLKKRLNDCDNKPSDNW